MNSISILAPISLTETNIMKLTKNYLENIKEEAFDFEIAQYIKQNYNIDADLTIQIKQMIWNSQKKYDFLNVEGKFKDPRFPNWGYSQYKLSLKDVV